jgi:ABC-2 type transport system ATP-binding protein
MSDVALALRGLTKRYGTTTAVDALDLEVQRGEIFGLLGPNGAGKTTTILMMLGLTEPTSGSVEVDGLDPRLQPLAVKRRVGYLPDDVGFYDSLTARQNLRYTAELNAIGRRAADARIDDLLQRVGLFDHADQQVGTFSRGMRQRLGLADALVKEPTILVLDEPTVNIDPEGVRQLLDVVDRLRHDEGVTILLSSHLLHQVEQVCDRIGIFVSGSLVALGSVAELAASLPGRFVYELGVDPADDDDLVARLRAVEGVDDVDTSVRPWLVTASHDCRHDLVRAVVGADASLWHLRHQTADLDAIYHRYFRSLDDDHDDTGTR